MSKLNQKCERCRVSLPDKFGRKRPYLCTDCEIIENQEKQIKLAEKQAQQAEDIEAESARLQAEYDQAQIDWEEKQYENERRQSEERWREQNTSLLEAELRQKMAAVELDNSLLEFPYLSDSDKLVLGENGIKTLNSLANLSDKELLTFLKKNSALITSKKAAKELIGKAQTHLGNDWAVAPDKQNNTSSSKPKAGIISIVFKFLLMSLFLLLVSAVVIGGFKEFITDTFGSAGAGFISVVAILGSLYAGYLFAKPKK